MLAYPVRLRKDGKFILVTFPDIPEAITQGDNREHALRMAAEALESAMEFYFEDRRVVPKPSKPKGGQPLVELPASVAAKALLLNEMISQKVRPAELARRIGTTPQEVNRLTNIRHASKIDGIAVAMKALGKTLEIRAVSADRL
ncbi:MAG: type II toxin-antitoxin system HicB family antitoxin [Terracidiphilus sp.]|jgi:antitoxin HicB